jgi:GT2 family glycosyltransferase
MTDFSDVAIVILNWNGKAFLEQFLPSVTQFSANAEIIVADNASTDHSIEWLTNHYPSVRLIQNDQNGGFAKGYNDALKHVNKPYYVLLNSDVEVTENWLTPLLQVMENPTVAGVQPKICSFNQKESFEYAGAAGGFIDRFQYPFCRGRILQHLEQDHHQYDYACPVFWTSGACMLIRSEIFWKVGGFDERFFAHMEEIDLCWRVQRLGFHFMTEPKSLVFHVGGGTLNYEHPRKTFLNFRNSLLMIHKNQQRALWWHLLLRLKLDGLAAIVFLFQGKFAHFKAVFNAHMSFYGLMKSSRIERKKWSHLTHQATIGRYDGSILWANYIQKVKKFGALNQRKFRS